MKNFLVLLCCHLCAIFWALPPATALAKNKADIVDLAVGLGGENLEASFRIKDCFTPKMEEAILSGVSTTFHIRIVLEKPGIPYLRSQYLDIAIEHTIKYDRLKNEFRVDLPEYPERVRVTKDFQEARQWMSHVRDLPVMPLWRLQKDQTYQLRIKAELSKVNLPAFFRYIFFFVSLWDFETDWQKITFSR